MSYAVIRTGGKQYRVEEGTTLLVERLTADEGATVELEPLLFSGDDTVFAKDDLARVKVQATVVGHERGPKLRVFKFKPKRGYKRRTGHRQDLTRIQVTGIELSGSRGGGGSGSGGRSRSRKKEEEA
jgi:large subunit ribosomal protein L21